MARLPVLGADQGTWGSILNDYLSVEHGPDGALRIRSDGTLTGLYKKPANGIDEADLSANVKAKLNASAPAQSVSSVAGKTGAVTLAQADIAGLSGALTTLTNNVAAKYTKPAGGIDSADLSASVNAKLNAAGNGGTAGVTSVAGRSGDVVLVQADITGLTSALAAKYTTPAGGVPEADLAAAVRTKLNAAGNGGTSAVDSVNGKTGAVVIARGDIAGLDAAITDAKAAGTAAQTTANAKYTKPANGIVEADLAVAVQNKLNASGGGGTGGAVDSVNGKTGVVTINQNDITDLVTDIADAKKAGTDANTAAGAAQTTANGRYAKPAAGIPETDLAQAVKDKLNATGGGTSAVSSVNGKTGAVVLAQGDISGLTAAIADAKKAGTDAQTDATAADTKATNAATLANTAKTTADGKYSKPTTGIPEADLAQAVKDKINAGGGTSAVSSVNGKTGAVVLAQGDISGLTAAIADAKKAGTDANTAADAAQATATAKYTKPAAGIPQSDVVNLTSDLAGKASATGGGQEAVVTVASSGATYAANAASGNLFAVTLTANCTLSITGATSGKTCSLTFALKQDGTGSRTVTWPGSVKWSGGTAPTLTTNGGKVDFISLLSYDGGSVWFGFISGANY